MDIGEILLTNNIELEVENIKQIYQNHRIYFESEFKIDNARAVINDSYISSNTTKCIVIAGNSFNIEAQNALLKVLEEPPKNIKFILITKSKNALLPTIISRLIIRNKREKIAIKDFELNLNNLNLAQISSFLKNLNYETKEEIRQKVQSLLLSAKKANINFNKNELEYFSDTLNQIECGEKSKYIFLQLLLVILGNKRQRLKK